MRHWTHHAVFALRMLCVLIFLGFMLASFGVAMLDAGVAGLLAIAFGAFVASGYARFAIGWRARARPGKRDALTIVLLLAPFALTLYQAGVVAACLGGFTAALILLCLRPSLLRREPD